jgi:hypothetical protein
VKVTKDKESKESEGSRASSTQEAIEALMKLKKSIDTDIDGLIFRFPKYRGLKHVAFIIGILFEDGSKHTIYPPDLKIAKLLLKSMSSEVEKREEKRK